MVKIFADMINALYDAFNVTIPGFSISISNIFLGIMLLSAILFVLQRKGNNNK